MSSEWLPQPYYSILLAIAAQFFGATMNTFTRLLELQSPQLHPFQLLFVRMGLTTLLITTYLRWMRPSENVLGSSKVRKFLVFRGVAGFLGIWGMYESLLTLPLTVATAIPFSAPVLALYCGTLLFGSTATHIDYLLGVISLIGITLNAIRLPLEHGTGEKEKDRALSGWADMMGGVAYGVLGSLGVAIGFMVMRFIGDQADALIIMNYASFASVFAAIVFLLNTKALAWEAVYQIQTIALIAASGISGFIFQYLLTRSLSYDIASTGAIHMMYTQIIFALIYDRLIWNTIPDALSLAGCVLILGSALCIAFRSTTWSQQNRSCEETGAGHSHETGNMLPQREVISFSQPPGSLPVEQGQN